MARQPLAQRSVNADHPIADTHPGDNETDVTGAASTTRSGTAAVDRIP